MEKRSNEICPCMGKGVQSPSLRALIDIVEKAEAKKAQHPATDPVPTNEQREPVGHPL